MVVVFTNLAFRTTQVLQFSFIGYTKDEVKVGTRTIIDLQLATDSQELNEVVITNYGGSLNKREFTGASSKIKGDALKDLPVQSFDRAIQGKAAGVQVTSANGVPGGAVQIRVRGLGSISAGSDPLYIVDGVQLNNTNNSSFTQSNPLTFLNPNDVESIEVLKDAAAASIYGSQAANGVVLVTTKRGKSGKTKIEFGYTKGVVTPVQYLNVLNTQQWIQARTEAVLNASAAGTEFNTARQSVLSSVKLDPTLSDAAIAALPTYDWQRESFRTGTTDNYELSLNGGNEKTKFFVSSSYNKQDANLRAVDFVRGTLNTTLTHTINSKLSIEEKINLSTVTQRGQFGSPNGGSFLGASAFSSPLMLPMNPIYNPDGSYYGTPADGGTAGLLNQNIIMVSDLNDIRATVNQMIGALGATWKITPELSFKPFVSLDYRTISGHRFTDPRTADAFNVKGRVQDQFNQNTNFLTNATLNYRKSISQHNFDILVGAEYRSDINEGTSSTAENVPTPAFQYASSAANPISIGGFWTGYHKESLFGSAKYDFANKYNLSLIARYDGSSRFGANNRFGFFPSASAAWLISEEDFLKGNKVLSELKLRISYGTTGNDLIGTAFGLNNFPSLGLFGGGFDYNSSPGIAPTQLANKDLKWEQNVTTNLGLDYGLFNGRITGAIDVFQRVSKDLLLGINLPYTSGYATISKNTGEVTNKGVELEINTVNVDGKNFKWKTNFNISFIQNKVTKLYDGITKLANPDSTQLVSYTDFYGVGRNAILGQPLLTNFTTQYAGVNPATGRAMFYDAFGNITYLTSSPRDQKYFGTELPKFYGGFTNSFSYKGITLDVFFQYDFGRKSFNTQGSFLSEDGGRLFNTLTGVYNARWQKPGDITDIARPYNGNTETRGSSNLAGTRTLEDASYIRLKSVSLGYDLPNAIIKKVGLSSLRVYAQALNLVTWTKWTGYDPEFLNLGSTNQGVVPASKAYTVGIKFGF